METIVVSGAKAIGSAVGVSWQAIPHYVAEHGLPAFRIGGKGNWLALPDDLKAWAIKMRDENIEK
jgi:hypothetical protein